MLQRASYSLCCISLRCSSSFWAFLLPAFLGLFLWPLTAQPEEPQNCSAAAPPQQQQPQPHCGLYIAESTLPDAGLGVFTAIPRSKGSTLGHGDVCVPFKDLYWNSNAAQLNNPFKDYFWSGAAMGMLTETDTDDVEALCFGLDCVVNCHLPLVNVAKAMPQYDDRLHRSVDPGAGAFSPYYNGSNTVTRDIPAGGEIFKYYGDHWFESRHRLFGNIPLTEDHQVAHRLLRKFVQMPALSDLYRLVLQMKQHWDSRTLNSLPDDLDDALLAATSNDMGVLHQPAATRSVDWLQEHGRCLDHIRPGPSTLPQAGRGAFATRYLPAGTRITTSPVHHVVDGESFFRMYKLTLDEDYVADEGEDDRKMWLRHLDQVVGSQIIKNYCFGHAQSSVMICPYSSGVQYINHNQTLANVRVAWGDGFFGHNSELVESGTLQDLETTTRSTLALDYMATRDIAEGEELLIDYGDAWEVAWAQHVNHFVPGVDPEYRSARAWNIALENKALRTLEESEDDPYPDNLQLRCHSLLMRTAGSRLRHFVWRDRDYGESCRILDRSNVNGTNLYTVQLELWPYDRDDKEITWMERRRVPRSAIRFFDMPATTDWHLSQAFRHVLHLPDDVFPEQWRNLA